MTWGRNRTGKVLGWAMTTFGGKKVHLMALTDTTYCGIWSSGTHYNSRLTEVVWNEAGMRGRQPAGDVCKNCEKARAVAEQEYGVRMAEERANLIDYPSDEQKAEAYDWLEELFTEKKNVFAISLARVWTGDMSPGSHTCFELLYTQVIGTKETTVRAKGKNLMECIVKAQEAEE